MKTKILCYSKCSTCKKALKWMDDNGYEYEVRGILEENPTAEELKRWHTASELPLKRFFNTSGVMYRTLELKDKIPNMTEEEQYKTLATDGMLVKRPLLVVEDEDGVKVFPGFREAQWTEILKG